MRTVVIIQARMGSTRLPGKALVDLAGRPMLAHVVDRVRRAERIDDIVVATTTDPGDDAIAAWCASEQVIFTRGPQEDVLHRYQQAARAASADRVVRVTSDCPLIDPALIDAAVRALDPGLAYASNVITPRTYPRGLDVEVFTREALEAAHDEDEDDARREHVTPFIRSDPQRFPASALRCDEDLSHHRWTVDTPEDLELVRTIVGHFDGDPPGWQAILRAVEAHPAWSALNAHIDQKDTR